MEHDLSIYRYPDAVHHCGMIRLSTPLDITEEESSDDVNNVDMDMEE